jgi:hydrogenase maturation protease
MTETGKKVLVFGYGNPGRLDDGLGPLFAEELGKLGLTGVNVDSNYQLSVEDAAAIAEHDYVVFVDADVSCPEPFRFQRVVPRAHLSFSSHSISAEALMAMAEELLSSKAEAFLLGIRGYEFNEFEERISPKAGRNLIDALAFMQRALEDGDLSGHAERFATEN